MTDCTVPSPSLADIGDESSSLTKTAESEGLTNPINLHYLMVIRHVLTSYINFLGRQC